jgi:hypothetical protein
MTLTQTCTPCSMPWIQSRGPHDLLRFLPTDYPYAEDEDDFWNDAYRNEFLFMGESGASFPIRQSPLPTSTVHVVWHGRTHCLIFLCHHHKVYQHTHTKPYPIYYCCSCRRLSYPLARRTSW